VINILIVYIILKTSGKLQKILGKTGISIIRKVFGIILLAIAVKLFATNVGKIVGY
jgi:multiple antibiotic resistance protein